MQAARHWERFLSCTSLPEATRVVAMNDYLNQACAQEPVESMQAALATCQVRPQRTADRLHLTTELSPGSVHRAAAGMFQLIKLFTLPTPRLPSVLQCSLSSCDMLQGTEPAAAER